MKINRDKQYKCIQHSVRCGNKKVNYKGTSEQLKMNQSRGWLYMTQGVSRWSFSLISRKEWAGGELISRTASAGGASLLSHFSPWAGGASGFLLRGPRCVVGRRWRLCRSAKVWLKISLFMGRISARNKSTSLFMGRRWRLCPSAKVCSPAFLVQFSNLSNNQMLVAATS